MSETFQSGSQQRLIRFCVGCGAAGARLYIRVMSDPVLACDACAPVSKRRKKPGIAGHNRGKKRAPGGGYVSASEAARLAVCAKSNVPLQRPRP